MANPSASRLVNIADGTDPSRLLRINSDGSINVAGSASSRYAAQMSAQGYFAENYQRQGTAAATTPTSGTVYYMALGLAAGDVVTNINLLCNVAGTGFSGVGVKVGIYTKASGLVASSGDVSALFASAGGKICPLTAPYTVPTTDGYFIALLNIGSANLTLHRAGTGLFTFGAFSGSQIAAGFQNTQTDLPATATITTNTNSIAFWVGVS